MPATEQQSRRGQRGGHGAVPRGSATAVSVRCLPARSLCDEWPFRVGLGVNGQWWVRSAAVVMARFPASRIGSVHMGAPGGPGQRPAVGLGRCCAGSLAVSGPSRGWGQGRGVPAPPGLLHVTGEAGRSSQGQPSDMWVDAELVSMPPGAPRGPGGDRARAVKDDHVPVTTGAPVTRPDRVRASKPSRTRPTWPSACGIFSACPAYAAALRVPVHAKLPRIAPAGGYGAILRCNGDRGTAIGSVAGEGSCPLEP